MGKQLGQIIKLREFGSTIEIDSVDPTTRETLGWFVFAALEADVDLENTAEVMAYCRYLIICLSKTEKLLNVLHKKDVPVLEIMERLGLNNEEG